MTGNPKAPEKERRAKRMAIVHIERSKDNDTTEMTNRSTTDANRAQKIQHTFLDEE